MLIVIVVIAILAAISIVAYNGIQERSRDSKRDSDIHVLKNAIEMYKIDHGYYPAACGEANDNSGCGGAELIPFLVPTYTSDLPFGPDHDFFEYNYVRSGGGVSYGLMVLYETKPVCKTGSRGTNFWGSSIPDC